MLAIQDESGGLFVRLPSAAAGLELALGTIIEVSGELAAPYGNLELRPRAVSDIVVVGSGGQPDPVGIGSSGVGEPNEGLLVVISGTVSGIDRRSRGALSVTIRDGDGSARVFIHAALGIDRSVVGRGQRVRVIGLVGQRASRSGAPDGHRVWPRSRADIEPLTDGEPGFTPPPGEGPPSRPPRGKRPRRVPIKDATPGSDVTIVGTVTSRAGFIDSEGRRVTVQDRGSAILVRYPADVKPAAVGRVIRAWGKVDTWFGTRQLEADAKPKRQGRSRVKATRLRRPPAEVDEWRLVSVSIRITDIQRDGDTWRAEGRFGDADSVPIVGLAGSGIPADALEEGRAARITGIVRRAHPSASDQRFSIAPRSTADIRLGRAAPSLDTEPDDESGATAAASSDDGGSSALTVNLGALATMTDVRVRVGGRLRQLKGRQLILEDGSGRGTVRLHDDIRPIEPALQLGEIVNVAGRVRTRTAGGAELVVRSAADVWRASSLGTPPGQQSPRSGSTTIDPVDPSSPAPDATTATGPIAPAAMPILLLVATMVLVALLTLSGAAMLLRHSRPIYHRGDLSDPQRPVAARPGVQTTQVTKPGHPLR